MELFEISQCNVNLPRYACLAKYGISVISLTEKPYLARYDDIDLAAMGRMTKERVEWTDQEDSLVS